MPVYHSVNALNTPSRSFKCAGKNGAMVKGKKDEEMTPEEKRKMRFSWMRKGKR